MRLDEEIDIDEDMKEDEKQKVKLQTKIQQIDDLPSLPGVVQRVNRIINQTGSTAEDVGEALKAEPSLTAKVLKMVNSSYFGIERRISSIGEAVVFVGFETVRNLVLNASVVRLSPEEQSDRFKHYDFNWEGFWRKSVATGIATETVAREIGVPDHKTAMPAGTLHMIGILTMASNFPSEFKEVLDRSREKNENYFKSEREVLGANCTEVGEWLSESWDIPDDTVLGLSHWLQPKEAPSNKQLIPLLVHVGERLARARNVGWNPEETVTLNQDVISELGITQEEFKSILYKYRQDLEGAQALLAAHRN